MHMYILKWFQVYQDFSWASVIIQFRNFASTTSHSPKLWVGISTPRGCKRPAGPEFCKRQKRLQKALALEFWSQVAVPSAAISSCRRPTSSLKGECQHDIGLLEEHNGWVVWISNHEILVDCSDLRLVCEHWLLTEDLIILDGWLLMNWICIVKYNQFDSFNALIQSWWLFNSFTVIRLLDWRGPWLRRFPSSEAKHKGGTAEGTPGDSWSQVCSFRCHISIEKTYEGTLIHHDPPVFGDLFMATQDYLWLLSSHIQIIML